MRDRAPRRRRLSRSAEFERVYRQGRSKGNRFLVLYAFPRAEESTRDRRRARASGCPCPRRVGGAVDRNRVKRVLREAFWEEAERLPAGSDYVVVARPDARDLAEREGMSGVRTALAELVDGLGGAPRVEGAREALVIAPIRAYQRWISPAFPRRCKYHPTCSEYAVQAIADLWHPQRDGARGLAHPALQPVQPRRLRPRLGPDPLPPSHTSPADLSALFAATYPVIQPLIDFFDAILEFFHDTVGLSWGFSIIALTILVRACLLPLTFKQFHSMQRLAHLQPEMKKLQERFKDDKERMNQEMMKFYRENKVNPFASCLPMVAQFPVFISLYYMLRIDLRHDICPEINGPVTSNNPSPCGSTPSVVSSSSSRPDGQGHRRDADHPDRALRRLAAVLDAADVDDDGQDAAHDLPGAAVRLRHLRHPVPGRPARLLDHHELWTIVQQAIIKQAPRPAAPGRRRAGSRRRAVVRRRLSVPRRSQRAEVRGTAAQRRPPRA